MNMIYKKAGGNVGKSGGGKGKGGKGKGGGKAISADDLQKAPDASSRTKRAGNMTRK